MGRKSAVVGEGVVSMTVCSEQDGVSQYSVGKMQLVIWLDSAGLAMGKSSKNPYSLVLMLANLR